MTCPCVRNVNGATAPDIAGMGLHCLMPNREAFPENGHLQCDTAGLFGD